MNVIPNIDKSFVMAVWWLHGRSAGDIAKALGLTKKTISGRIDRRFVNTREELGIGGRQALLDELKTARKDDGVLPDKHFTALPLKATQRKVAPARPRSARTPKPLETKPLSRRELRRREKEAERQKLLDEKGRAVRQLAPFEQLIKTKILGDPIDAPGTDSANAGRRREEAGLNFRRYFAGQTISGLKSLNYEGLSGGGTTGLPPSAYRLHCLEVIGHLRQMMTVEEFDLLEAVVDRDEYVWDRVRVRVVGVKRTDKQAHAAARAKAIGVAQEAIYESLRCALDVICVYEGRLLSPWGFKARWNRMLPDSFVAKDGERRPLRVPTMVSAIGKSKHAGELLREGRRG